MPGKSKRPWRKELKKQQRKRRRQKAAEARDLQLEEEEAYKLNDPAYQEFLQQQARRQEEQLREAERLHAQEEEAWLRRDLLAIREFRLKKQQREVAEAAEAAKRKQQEEELAAKLAEQQRRREAQEKREAAAAAEFEQMIQHMESFLNNTGPAPAELRRVVESRPGQSICVLYERTNCCRYGSTCNNNHRRPLLSNIIVVRNFFMHPLLEEKVHKEYAEADSCLELNEQDLCESYNEFFDDVVPELEGFGVIRNFRAVRNVLRHMRGHVFVEYFNERSALKAFIRLQGRFYAGRQLNVEFSSITVWESAVCGLAKKRKCSKGNKCYYLHLLTNPGNKYNTPLVMQRTPNTRASTRIPDTTPLLSWTMVTSSDVEQKSRNWRWSESPEVEILSTTKFEKEKSEKKDQKQHCSRSNSKYENQDLSHISRTRKSEEKVNDDSKSRRRRKKGKHEREKSSKKHKRKRSHSSERKNDQRVSSDGEETGKYEREKSSEIYKRKPSRSSERVEERKESLDREKDRLSKDKSRKSYKEKYKEDSSARRRSSERSDDKLKHRSRSSSSKECKYASAEETSTERKPSKSNGSDRKSYRSKKNKRERSESSDDAPASAK